MRPKNLPRRKRRRDTSARYAIEALERRILLSGAQTLADLPLAAQQTISAAIAQDAKLTASDGAAGDNFGTSVSISGNTLVVGAENKTIGGNIDQGAAYVFTESGSVWTQVAKLTASDGTAADAFGRSVSVSGNTVVVGAMLAAVGNNYQQGAAYVFTEPGSGWANMTQTAKLAASDGVANDWLGSEVWISGNTVVAGATAAKINGNGSQGAAYIFTRSGSVWTQTAKLTASDGAAGALFGSAVSVSGNTVAVGAQSASVGGSLYQGAAYVFADSGSGWTQVAKLTSSDGAGSDQFGYSICVGGNTVVVGAELAALGGKYQQGAAYVFTEPGSGWANMTQTAKLTASDGAAGDWFGTSVSISGNMVVVGAQSATIGGRWAQGAAYLFTESGSNWAQTAKFTASDGAAKDYFGISSISGNTVVAGAPIATVGGKAEQGAAYLFSAPALALTTPATAASVNEGSNYTINWTGGNSTDTIQIWAEGGPNNAWIELTTGVPQTNGSYTWNTTGVAHGWYYFEAWDNPTGGTPYAVQSPNWLHVVAPAAAAPNLSITNPPLAADSVAQGNTYTLNFTAADGSGDTNPIHVQLWDYSGNTGLWTELPNANYLPAAQGHYDWNTTGMAPGWYSFSAHATNGDLWSYASSPGWLHVTVPTPTIAITTPTSGQSVVHGGTFNLNWNITGLSGSDLSSSTVQIWAQHLVNGSSVWTEIAASVNAANGTFAWSVPASPGAGTYYAFSIYVNDGNMWWAQSSPNWLQVT